MDTLYSANGWTVALTFEHDDGVSPDDFDCYSPEDKIAWKRDEWEFVNLRALVWFEGVQIGEGNIGAVAHGSLADVEVDAFEMTPGKAEDGVTTMGSPAWDVVTEAIDDAAQWLRKATGHQVFDGITAMLTHFGASTETADPIDQQDEAHGRFTE